jgi:hypothetical protein
MPNATAVTSEDELSQKRQLVYASLLRYAPETAPLRERIFDRLVMAALMGSDGKNAYRIGAVQSNLVFGANVPRNLRVERVQESLKRLQDQGKVELTQIRQRHAYYLSTKGQDELRGVIGTAADVLQPVLKKLLANTSHSLSYEAGSKIVQGFIFECFARFGAQMAKTVTGQLEASDLLRNADAAAAFDAAVAGADLSAEMRESLQSRCIQFLKSGDSDDLNLKFCLAQGYYFAQLVGLQDGSFSPLAEQAFNGSSFYLDTNVLLYGLLPDKEDRAVFAELLVLAERLSIKLEVTRATIKETLSLPDNFSKELSRVLKVLPGELIDRVKDQLTESFLRARDENPGMTLDVFLEDIRGVQEVVKTRWGISILEEAEDQILAGDVPAGIATVIQEEAVKSRGWEKPEAALRHDVAHFFLVQRERSGNPKSWFLTRDRGLAVAATLLAAQGEQPFTFDFHGFLQTVSPFLVSTGEQLGVASIISAMLVDQLFPRDRVFNLKELFLLAEMHQDVLSTPKEQLIQAVDYVKSTVLAGKTYKPADFNHVSLGLKSFLACSAEQQRQELERQKGVSRTGGGGAEAARSGGKKATAGISTEDPGTTPGDRGSAGGGRREGSRTSLTEDRVRSAALPTLYAGGEGRVANSVCLDAPWVRRGDGNLELRRKGRRLRYVEVEPSFELGSPCSGCEAGWIGGLHASKYEMAEAGGVEGGQENRFLGSNVARRAEVGKVSGDQRFDLFYERSGDLNRDPTVISS